jgi:2-iminobutanoate/2-iminopropanoate deaminase
VSGCLGLDPKTGDLVSDNVVEQTGRALQNMRAVLASAQCTMSDVVKCTVLLRSMDDFAAVNEVYAHHFSSASGTFPARVCYAVNGLPKDALVEIDAIAQQPSSL